MVYKSLRCLYCLEFLTEENKAYGPNIYSHPYYGNNACYMGYSYQLQSTSKSFSSYEGTRAVGTDYLCWNWIDTYFSKPTMLHKKCKSRRKWCIICDECDATT